VIYFDYVLKEPTTVEDTMHRMTKLLIVAALILFIAATSTFFSAYDSHEDDEGTVNINDGQPLPARHTDYVRFNVNRTRPLEKINFFDFGFDDVYIELLVPDVLPPGNALIGELIVSDARQGMEYLLTWYIDDEIVSEERVTIGEDTPFFEHNFKYTRIMAETAVVRAKIQYTTRHGEDQELTFENTVVLENYGITHWIEREAERVQGLISSRYEGDRTLQWAIDNDYDDFEKVVFVNAMGYESETDYLLWVNRAYQRLNVFEKCYDTETWKLIEVFIIATGGRFSMTQRGVTTIPSRTREGWYFTDTTPHYFVRPVVRFFPGTGYAFHSRPFYRVGELRDERIGFPVSAGCVRMYCDDIWYIYNNIPDGTTVVIY
jgi:hypothetical protein